MRNENLKTTIDQDIAILTLNRAEQHNAFDDRLIADLTAELKRLEGLKEVRAIILAGEGKSFSAGADLNWMKRMAGYSHEENYRDIVAVVDLMKTLDALAKPTIARVQGAAFGGGVGLVACCDIAIASEEASFCLSEVKLGLIPAAISPYVTKCIGEKHARRYFVTAERFDAGEARRIGLVHEVVPAGHLDQRISEIFRLMRNNGPLAMAAGKMLARDVSRGVVDQAMMEETARRIADIRVSPEGQEGITAFLEKRIPDWSR